MVGVALGWLMGRSRMTASLAQAVAERDQTRAAVDALRQERDELKTSREQAAVDITRLTGELNAAQSTVQAERRAAAERDKRAEEDRAAMAERFEALASRALRNNSETVVKLAKEQLSSAQKEANSELDKRTTAVHNLVKPLADSLIKVDEKVTTLDQDRQKAFTRLDEQLRQFATAHGELRKETASLVDALRRPQSRGQWGEMQLRRAVEMAGMVEHCDFVEQETVRSGEGGHRPDMIVRLPENRSIVVDAKVSMAAFLEASEADDAATRKERMRAHAKHLRNHVDDLASKAYWDELADSPEFVILFVPGEAILAPALEQVPDLLDYAFGKRVFIATPTILIATLRSVAYLLQQAEVTENALEIQKLGRELYKRLGTMGGHMDKLGRSLTTSVKDYNSAVGSLERNVLTSARKLNAMGVTDTELAQPRSVEEAVRELSRAELMDSVSESRPVSALPPAAQEPTNEDQPTVERSTDEDSTAAIA